MNEELFEFILFIIAIIAGFVAGVNAARRVLGEESVIFPTTMMLGAMAKYISTGNMSGNFVPMNANFGIIEPLGRKIKGGKVAKYEVVAERALNTLPEYAQKIGAQNYQKYISEQDGE